MLKINNLCGFWANSNRPVFVGGFYFGTSDSQGGSNQTISLSGTLTGGVENSPKEGDTVIVCYSCSGVTDRDTSVITSGYTQIADLYANDTRDCNLGISWKRMGAVPDSSVDVRSSGANTYGYSVTIHVWRNLNPSNPVTKIETAIGIDSTLASPPTITPEVKNSIIIPVYAATGDSSQIAYPAPPGLSNVFKERGNGSGQDNALLMGSIEWNGGAYTPPVGSGLNTSTSDSWCAATLSIA